MRTDAGNKGGPRDVRLGQASLEEIAGELHRRARRACGVCAGRGESPCRPGVICLACDGTGVDRGQPLGMVVAMVRSLAGQETRAEDICV